MRIFFVFFDWFLWFSDVHATSSFAYLHEGETDFDIISCRSISALSDIAIPHKQSDQPFESYLKSYFRLKGHRLDASRFGILGSRCFYREDKVFIPDLIGIMNP